MVDLIELENKYDEIGEHFSNGFFKVRRNKKWGCVNEKGKEVIPCKYHLIYEFREGLAKVFLNGKWGFINEQGEEVIPLKYDSAFSYCKGIAIVKLNKKWGCINTNGEIVVPLKYSYILREDNYILTALEGKRGFIAMDNLSVFNEFTTYILNIGSRNDTLYYTKYKDTYIFKTGCFMGTLKEFEDAVKETHSWNSLVYNEYMSIIKELKEILADEYSSFVS